MDWAEIPDRIVSVFFPQRCLFCGEVVAYDDFWCEKCGEGGKLPYTRFGRVECDFPHSFDGVLAALEYSGRVRELIWRLKDVPDKRILQFFAGEMRVVMAEYWNDIRFDLIVPVPSTASRLKERGFNHAESLARHISRYTVVPVRGDALTRHENTRMQRGLIAAERRVNAEKSYSIGNQESVAGKTVLLVDDVFTTGYTAAACSDRLLAAGARRVYAVTVSAKK